MCDPIGAGVIPGIGSAFTWRMGSRMRPRSALRQARSKAAKRPARTLVIFLSLRKPS